MPAFSIESKQTKLELPRRTKEQIAALMSSLEQDARSIIIIAIQEMWERELAPEGEQDVFAALEAWSGAHQRYEAWLREMDEKIAHFEQLLKEQKADGV